MIPITVPPYYQAAHHVEVIAMRNFSLDGRTQQTPLTKMNKGETTIYFNVNISQLNQRQKNQLQRLKPRQYKIIGFASAIGNADFNRLLSVKRAFAVADFLKERGSSICGVDGKGILHVDAPYAQKVIVRISRC